MRFLPLLLSVMLISLLGCAGPAAAHDVLSLVRAGRWAEADAAASGYADPVARKLVLYYRLLAPNAAELRELVAFVTESPDWPQPATLLRRRDEALAVEADDGAVLAECDRPGSAVAGALARLRCADAMLRAGRSADSAAMVRAAWIATPTDAAGEARFMQRWGSAVGAADQWERFDRLAWTDTAGAMRQIARLGPGDKPRAEVRLALRRDDSSAPALVAALPAAQRAEPGIVLEQAKWLRRAGQDDDAVALWRAAGNAAERAAPVERRGAFWDERNLLARRRMRQGDWTGAFALAAGHAQTATEQVADAEFLAGFVALRRLNDPAAAQPHFQALAEVSRAGITQARAHYWLGRTAAAAGDSATAGREYAAGAAWPNTFYGQLCAIAAGDTPERLAARIVAAGDPPADADRALALAGRELARAAAYLASWSEPRRADAFLLRLADVTPDPADRALAGRLARGLGFPEVAIGIARLAGRAGIVMVDTGWPQAADIPADAGVEPALALGIIRQESSFDSATTSPVGARGLMQLMPATAAQVSRKLGLPASIPALTADPRYNIRLGTEYLRGLMDQYGGAIPLTAAGYNAGPGRVTDWVAGNGDPRSGGVDMVDWIELIPFGETRNYVQRVIENTVIYRAKRGEAKPHPALPS